ncbi:cytochrome P450 [Xylaria arbuscula]|nr:cytochrome P450 [Xylaria arbuscula]
MPLALLDNISISWSSVALWPLLFFAVAIITRLITMIRFYRALSVNPKELRKTIPVVPYWVPVLSHLLPFVSNMAKYPLYLMERYGRANPLRIHVFNVNVTIVANPKHITAIFKNHRYLSSRSITERSARYLLGVPSTVIPFYQADDSGMEARPREGSTVAPENRILYQQTYTAQKFLASPYLEPLSQRYLTFFASKISSSGIGEDLVQFPSLYAFCQEVVTEANIKAMMGTKITELDPNIAKHFWEAKQSAPEYFRGFPRWLIPSAFAARDRIIESVMKWHEYGFSHGNHTNTSPKDPDWDPIWGSKYAKIRQQFMLKMKPLTAPVRGAEDWGLMFGANGNTAPIVFWYLLEALKDPHLCARMIFEVKQCISDDGKLNICHLEKQPLLQSVFAEVLRMRVSIFVSRIVEHRDIVFDGYILPQGEIIIMPTEALHNHHDAWAKAGWETTTPLMQFDPDRFIINSEFNQDGLAGVWIPFGGGNRMCPGRHIAKLEVITSFAYLFLNFDFEAALSDLNQVTCDRRYAGFGAMPPDRTVPFRIRKKYSR